MKLIVQAFLFYLQRNIYKIGLNSEVVNCWYTVLYVSVFDTCTPKDISEV